MTVETVIDEFLCNVATTQGNHRLVRFDESVVECHEWVIYPIKNLLCLLRIFAKWYFLSEESHFSQNFYRFGKLCRSLAKSIRNAGILLLSTAHCKHDR